MKIALVTSAYEPKNFPLQPWRYLSEIARGLSELGHEVRVFTDVTNDDPAVVKLPNINLASKSNSLLFQALDSFQPDVCLWHLGLTSVLNFDPKKVAWPTYAIFTSPIYKLSDLLSLGLKRLWQARDYALIHLVGAILPRYLVKNMLQPLQGVITESAHNAKELERIGIPRQKIYHIAPGVDDIFRAEKSPPPPKQPFTVLYMGSPLPVRGVFDLLEAVAMVNKEHDVRLNLLSRGKGEYTKYDGLLKKEVVRLRLTDKVNLVTGFLLKAELVKEMQKADLIALPFQIVPSDVPLAVLEAMAMGKAVLGTSIDSLPEYLGQSRGFLCPPGRPDKLAVAIRAAMSPDLNAQMAQNALTYAKMLSSWTATSAKLMEVILLPKNEIQEQNSARLNRHIYITGVDGVGKTTQMNLLEARLQRSERVHRVWIRYPVLFSLPLLVYARLRGYTNYEVIDGLRVGAWNFEKSKLLTSLFPWTQYIDTVIYSFFKVFVPIWQNKNLLFERFALDVLVDIAVAINEPELHTRSVGKRLIGLIPKNTRVIILDAPEDQLRLRRADLKHDPVLTKRLKYYRKIAASIDVVVIKSDVEVEKVSQRLSRAIVL